MSWWPPGTTIIIGISIVVYYCWDYLSFSIIGIIVLLFGLLHWRSYYWDYCIKIIRSSICINYYRLSFIRTIILIGMLATVARTKTYQNYFYFHVFLVNV